MDERNYRMESESGVRDSRLGRILGRGVRDTGVNTPANDSTQYQSPAAYGSPYNGSGVVINSPKTYEDVQLLIDHLKLREQVIVDFSMVNQASVYRILDFMSGAIYALGGSIQQITKNIFLFAPAGVTITVPPQLSRR